MAREVKSDKLVGQGTLADKLRKKRLAAENLDVENMPDPIEPVPGRDDYRGFTKEKWEDNT